MITIDDAVVQCRAKPVPVLFLDACAVVDLVRFGRENRDKIKLRVLEDAQRLIGASQRGAVRLVGLELLALEVDDHLATEVQLTLSDFDKITKRLTLALEGLDLRIGPGSAAAWSGLGASLLTLPYNLRVLAETLMAQVELLHDDPVCIELARIRAVLKFAPSHKKESRKDCEIFEHALALSRQLKHADYAFQRVLVTSNTNDFERRALEHELMDAGLELASSFADAYGLIGRP